MKRISHKMLPILKVIAQIEEPFTVKQIQTALLAQGVVFSMAQIHFNVGRWRKLGLLGYTAECSHRKNDSFNVRTLKFPDLKKVKIYGIPPVPTPVYVPLNLSPLEKKYRELRETIPALQSTE